VILERFEFQYKTGARSFLGDANERATWVDEKIDGWISSAETLAKVAKRYPQTAYAGLTRSLQMEWQYTLRVVPEVVAQFERVKSALVDSFLPILFGLEEEPAVSEGVCV
jgi:hypothetical protein